MSKGMQQRLGIAQALVGEPRLLLLDEPTSALDPVGRRTVRVLLEELRGRGVAVLLNSHLLSEVELVCDRVAILLGGAGRRRGRARPSSRARAGSRSRPTRACGASRAPAARTRPRLVAEAGRRRAAGLRRARRSARRSRTSTSRPSAGRPSERRRRHRRLRAARGACAGKVFLVVLVLTAAVPRRSTGSAQPASSATCSTSRRRRTCGVDTRTFAGATLLGLAMFGTLFLGVVLAVFLTLGVVRATPSAACCSRSSCGRSGARPAARPLPRRAGRLRAYVSSSTRRAS